jgi:hypothetical protein
MAIVRRRQNPPEFKSYKSYKKYLRIDFRYRCAYCRMHEYTLAGLSNFGVDHFEPKSKARHLACAYKNLYYCCNECNRIKRDVWPTGAERARGYRFADACSEIIYGEHLKCHFNGKLEALTTVGDYTEQRINLNREDLRRLREDRNIALRTIRESRNALRDSTPLPKKFKRYFDAQQTALELLIRLYLNPPTPPGRKQLRQKRAGARR